MAEVTPGGEQTPLRRIYLVGLPGSGKSTIAPIIAQRLGCEWRDLDREIERQAGQTIPTLFAQGEAAFRAIEAETLRDLPANQPMVVATGGGVVIDPANREYMQATGEMVWLRVAPDSAVRRLAQHDVARPLLQGDMRERLQTLLDARQAWYASAPIAIATEQAEAHGGMTDRAPEAITADIIRALQERGMLADSAPLQIPVNLADATHTIHVGVGLRYTLPAIMDRLRLPRKCVVIVDAQVQALHGSSIVAALREGGYDAQVIAVPAGEASKSLSQIGQLYDALIAQRHARDEAIIALGGGVVGDLAGFAAATYLRGVPVIQVPTTLLAMVDSAIGGKTGINHPLAKNAIGAFYQPCAVVIDPAFLLTLNDRLYREGFGEIVKYGVALDAALFTQLEAAGVSLLTIDPAVLTPIIARCARIKADIVSQDEREGGQRMLLNYGHTIGHALEAVTGYGALLHGEAVFHGMAVAARIAQRMGLIPAELVARQDALSAIFQSPPIPAGIAPEAIIAATQLDKKARAGKINWVLPTALGQSTTRNDVPDEVVRGALDAWLAHAQAK